MDDATSKPRARCLEEGQIETGREGKHRDQHYTRAGEARVGTTSPRLGPSSRRHARDALAFTGHFVRSYKTAEAEAFDTLAFAEPPEWVVYAGGIEAVAGGARIRGGRGRFLITLYWPWITHLRVEVQRNTPKDTSVRFRSRGVDLGGAVYKLGGDDIAKWPLPPGGLDSGINEIVVEADGDVTLQRMQFIDESEHDLSLQ